MERLRFVRTTAADADFIQLVKSLDAELAIIDGEDHAFYNQYNGLDEIKYALVCYLGDQPVACGAIKQYDDTKMEVKRMYTHQQHRNKGIASQLISALEQWAKELGFQFAILETGKRQADAVALYTKCGYSITENYGQYAGVDNSCCFSKAL